MKDNYGFTIVELLASISLLLIISIFVINRITNSDSVTKEQLYNTKVKLILSSAYKYGSDHIDNLSNNCTYITVSDLIKNNYLVGDSENKLEIINPKTNESMNYYIVCIKYEDGKILTSLK